MKRRPEPCPLDENPAPPAADSGSILQIKVWLLGISPMVWRRVQVPSAYTLRELHGVIQVAMGWEGIHQSGLQSATQVAASLGLSRATRATDTPWLSFLVPEHP